MLPPPPVLTGPKGGRYVETSAGRQYVDEDYGKRAERPKQLETSADKHAQAQQAVEKILSIKAPAEMSARIKEAVGNGTTFTIKDGNETLAESHLAHGMMPDYIHLMAAEKIKSAISWDEAAGHPTNTPVEKQINFKKRDALHAIGERLYEKYKEARDNYNKERELQPNDPDYEPLRPNPAAALALSQHMHEKGLGEVHGLQSVEWVRSSSSPGAMRLHGALQSLGVPGSLPEGQDEHLDQGAKNEDLKRYVREMYNLTQAALERDGIKEVKLYRGVTTEKYVAGRHESVELVAKARPASSWTDRFDTAEKFTKSGHSYAFVMETKVPAAQIYAYHKLFGNASGENEFVVLGMEGKKVEAIAP